VHQNADDNQWKTKLKQQQEFNVSQKKKRKHDYLALTPTAKNTK
jgi:hypothetical protein